MLIHETIILVVIRLGAIREEAIDNLRGHMGSVTDDVVEDLADLVSCNT